MVLRLTSVALVASALLPLGAAAQDADAERVEWLRAHAVPVRSIDPEDEDFSDLEPLVARIGAARVVALGEPSHGDGAVFLAKHRLIRFLHQRMGFDVLAWESGLFDCRLVERALGAGEPPAQAARSGIFPIFSDSGHVVPVVSYAASTRATLRPLEIAGFDCQLSSERGREELPRYLAGFFDAVDGGILAAHDGADALAHLCRTAGDPPADEEADDGGGEALIAGLVGEIAARRADFERAHGAREVAFAERVLGNLLVFDRMGRAPRTSSPMDTNLRDTNLRDQRMGENVAWLARERYAGRKIILWAASFHLMRNSPAISSETIDYAGTVTLGDVAFGELERDYYAVGFLAHHGQIGSVFGAARPLAAAEVGSLEHVLHEVGRPYALLDLRTLDAGGDWLAGQMRARPLGYSPMVADWTQVFDAFIFIDEMFASTRDGTVPAGVLAERQRPESPLARLLADVRRALIGYGLDFDSVFPKRPAAGFDAARVQAFAAGAWPDVLGHADTDPDGFAERLGDVALPDGVRGGAWEFTSPLSVDLALDGYHTLVLLEGAGPLADIASKSYGTLVCDGPMAGRTSFDSYATAYIDGDLSGSLRASSYFVGVITGVLSGTLELESYALVYALGGFTGQARLKGSKLALAGFVASSQLAQISGRGTVYLERSDLAPGEHTFGEVKVIVGPNIVFDWR